MEQTEGFIVPGKEKKVCKLVKSLYGLKQALKQWHAKFDQVMLANGFKINECDKCVYIKNVMNHEFIALDKAGEEARMAPEFPRGYSILAQTCWTTCA